MSEQAVERMLPLYEAKMIHHYDHRWATYEPDGSIRNATLAEKQDPDFVVQPRYWVREAVVDGALAGAQDLPWMVGVRDICRSTDERTVISSLFPRSAVGNNLPVVLEASQPKLLTAVLSSFALDFVARPKVGGVHLNFFIANQLPVLPPAVFELACTWSPHEPTGDWIARRVDALMGGTWNQYRPHIRAELDSAMFHLYDLLRADVDYIMEAFPIVKRKDEAAYGEFRTKRLILDVYDQMAEAIATGTTYRSSFDEELE